MTGIVLAVVRTLLDSVFYLAAAWAVLLVGRIVTDTILSSTRIKGESVDANLVRLAMRIVSFLIAVYVIIEGARAQGVPVVGVIAGLGVGGLAVALAAQSTIENFIGSITIFADRPVRVGDFCRFGDQIGTVEHIGLRSTRIRTLERSIVTVPNAEFSRLQIDNLTKRDQILFKTILNLRLETTADQLQRILDRVRELLLENESVDDDPARIRLVTVGPYSLDLEIFAYIETSDWTEFLTIRQDIYMDILRVIEEAGTALAPPAETHYVRSGDGDRPRAPSADRASDPAQ